MLKLLLPSILLACQALAGTEPVTDEALRAAALAAAFPGTQISPVAGKIIDSTWRPQNLKKNALTYPDALAREKVYRVVGKPMNETEQCAAGRSSRNREVRFRLYMWPGAAVPDVEWLAVMQYRFPEAPADSLCTSIPLLLHLTRAGSNWTVDKRLPLETHSHIALEGIQLLDLTGDGREELVVESDSGEVDAAASDLHVFDLSHSRFDELLNMASRMSASVMDEEQYMQTLDVSRTLKSRGKQFCFVKTTYAEEGKWFPTPRVSKVCYERGRGVERDGAQK